MQFTLDKQLTTKYRCSNRIYIGIEANWHKRLELRKQQTRIENTTQLYPACYTSVPFAWCLLMLLLLVVGACVWNCGPANRKNMFYSKLIQFDDNIKSFTPNCTRAHRPNFASQKYIIPYIVYTCRDVGCNNIRIHRHQSIK